MEPEDKTSKKSVDYESKVAEQEVLVKKLAEEYQKNPSTDLQRKLTQETDLLRHYSNASKGDPKSRAKQAAETARRVTINKAVQQIK